MTPGQLNLFAEPPAAQKPKGGSLPHGPVGLLMALRQNGLRDDAVEPAARLVALLDAGAAARAAGGKR